MKPRFDLSVLLEMLTYKRPSGSDTEHEFIDRYIASMPDAVIDEFSNWHVRIGKSPIVWSCHTDTVHRTQGRQTVRHDPNTGVIDLARRSKRGSNGSSCLGADDTAGVFLCVSMIAAGVDGHYIFHYGEEIGGNGSGDLARHRPDLLDGARFAIALDRQDFGDVITHQAGDRCCSDAFANSLADQLNRSGLTFGPCDRGVFTDTANYTDTIAECTNLSVGYFDQHSRQESVNARHLETLLTALCEIDPSALIESRKPGDSEGYTFCGHLRSFVSRTSTSDVLIAECLQCGDEYDPACSFARDFDRYCSPECEDDHGHSLAKTIDRIYLDPAYAEIARQLREVFGETEDK